MSDLIITVPQNEINTKLPDKFVLVCFVSFEQRSMTVPLSLKNTQISKAIIFKSLNTDNEYSLNKICNKIPNNQVIELDLNNPVSVARILTKVVKDISDSENISLVIDVTTFTHETLAMFLKLIFDNKTAFSSVFFLYNGAVDYSNSKKDGLKQMWLSKGCRDVRNIVGYPGVIRPVAKTCLIILTGFELERATGLIEILEPDKLVLGIGIEPTHDNNKEAMEYFREKFKKWKKKYKNSNCSEFNFSCNNIYNAFKALENLILANPDDNYIIVPLNTKLSTIAASLVALHNTKIQICYAVPEFYNTKNYSSPSENITIFDLYKAGIIDQ